MQQSRTKKKGFFYKILGPATVEGALQGCSAEARQQWLDFRARAEQAKRDAAATDAP